MAVGQNQWYHFGIGAPTILVYFSWGWDVHWDPWPCAICHICVQGPCEESQSISWQGIALRLPGANCCLTARPSEALFEFTQMCERCSAGHSEAGRNMGLNFSCKTNKKSRRILARRIFPAFLGCILVPLLKPLDK